MTTVQDMPETETTAHGVECFCQLCRPEIVDDLNEIGPSHSRWADDKTIVEFRRM